MRTDHGAIEAQTGITYIAVALLVTFHKLLFQPQAFSLSLYEEFLSSFIDEVCAKVGLWTAMYQSNRNFNISPPPPGEHTPGMWHPHRPGRREFDYQSPPGGGEFELHAQFHVKSLAWRALIGTVVLEDFRGKDCAFEANWLRVLCRIWRYLNFNIFNIGFRLWINECNKLCV